jgi:succinylglutamic semialdehyde dehydrogenase
MASALNEPFVPALGDYVGGRFAITEAARADGCIERVSPRDFDALVARHHTRFAAVDEAVARAREAFHDWALSSLDTRKQLLVALKQQIAARRSRFVELLAHELGKPTWEGDSEVAAALAKVDVTLSDGLALATGREMGGPAQRYVYRPHGVGAVLGPFNFPLHLVHGHVVPALLMGNTVVVKPSELAPSVGQLYAECFHAAGFPAGVFNSVQGDGSAGAKLAAHPDVDLVMFTGSYAVGQAIKRATLDQPHKLLALELGGRNPAIVLADADLDKAVHDVLWGAYVTAGQRCSGTAVAMVERALFVPFRDKLLEKLARVRVGDPLQSDVFMGPLVSESARTRYLASLARAEQQGVVALHPAAPVEIVPRGAYVRPSVHEVQAAGRLDYELEELFGPDLALEAVDDLDQAIARANGSPYGLSVSVFSASEGRFEYAFPRLAFGCVNWNAPTCGASSRLPFGGTRRSGNHRPAALFSTLYASYPVAHLRGTAELDTTKLSPGLTW